MRMRIYSLGAKCHDLDAKTLDKGAICRLLGEQDVAVVDLRKVFLQEQWLSKGKEMAADPKPTFYKAGICVDARAVMLNAVIDLEICHLDPSNWF